MTEEKGNEKGVSKRAPGEMIETKKAVTVAVLAIFLIGGGWVSLYYSNDPDGDGLSNLEEIKYGSDPHKRDTSGDGLSDSKAIDYLLDPAMRHHPEFVEVFKRIEPVDRRTARLLCLTIYGDEKLSNPELTYISNLNLISYRKAFENIAFVTTRDYLLEREEVGFTGNFTDIVTSYPEGVEELTNWVLSDQEISKGDHQKISYLKENHQGVTSCLLSKQPMNENEWRFIEILATSETPVEEQIMAHSYHKDGNISGWELFCSQDDDGDRVINIREMSIGTSMDRCDSDGDGLSDYQEEFEYPTDPTLSDSDFDNLNDKEEIKTYNTLPLNPDTDDDGIRDGDEVHLFSSDPRSKNPMLKEVITALYRGGSLDTHDIKYVKLLSANPHNIREQILYYGYHQDGEITLEEYDYCTDRDTDGLILKRELEEGTDPYDPDTDKDGLLDGWEIYGVETSRGNRSMKPVHLSKYGADPLHKDIFIEMIGETKISENQKLSIEKAFESALVPNPDGVQGINIHIDDDTPPHSLGGENAHLSEYSGRGLGAEVGKEHHRYGTFYFGKIKGNMSESGLGEIGGFNFALNKNILEDDDTTVCVFVHEVGHNILGYLDKKNCDESKENIHSKYRGYAMYSWPGNHTYHPNVWNEIERDGILGLPTSPMSIQNSRLRWEIDYTA